MGAFVPEGWGELRPAGARLRWRAVRDVIVIGSGGAGIAAAIAAAEAGASVTLLTKFALGASNTGRAQGGLQAAVGSDDDLATHAADTLRAGHDVGDPVLVEALVGGGPDAVAFLTERGVRFGRAGAAGGPADGAGPYHLLPCGGTTRARLLQAGDATGAAIVKALRPGVAAAGVEVVDYTPVDAIEARAGGDGFAVRGHRRGDDRPREHTARTVVLAAGGRCARVAAERRTASTNHPGATGEVTQMAVALGATTRELDSLQWHPTGGVWPEKVRGFAVPETVRSLGAILVDADGRQIVDPLAPRDVVADAVRRTIDNGRGSHHPDDPDAMGGAWLDCRPIDARHGDGHLAATVPHAHRRYAGAGVDLAREPVLVRPILHYQNGGLVIDADGVVAGVPGLFAAGEITGGLHGTNRLMGNSLLDIVVFGRRAGRAAAAAA